MNFNDINEDIRQYRLYRIQTTEQKLRKFTQAYNEIKEHLVIKFTKNVSLNLIRLILALITMIFIVLAILYFFPGKLIGFIEKGGEKLTAIEKGALYLTARYFSYFFLFFAFVSFYIGYLLKKNIRSRNSIFKLNGLLKEVIAYMTEASNDEKRKYEYYVDNLQEIENRKRAMHKE